MGLNVLVFNCGSSSLKYRLIEMPGEAELAGGEAQRVGPKTEEPARIVHHAGGTVRTYTVEMPDHAAAFTAIMTLLSGESPQGAVSVAQEGEPGAPSPGAPSPGERDLTPAVIAHRLVHGGQLFSAAAAVDEETLAKLESIAHLAPIHNPPATALVRACARLYPRLPQVLVFDTAFHASIPDYAATYPLPRWLREDLGIRKYGFHGTSHHYVAQEAARFFGRPLSSLDAVSCHLGSGGASLCAIVGGRSVDNTMGYSPLQGLLMSTRSGDLDPAVVMRLLARNRGDAEAVEQLLNRRSGVLGLSGSSADIRDLLSPSSHEESARRELALELYLWRLRKYLGSYLTLVGDAQAIIFTDTVGETVPAVRRDICADLDTFGVVVDSRKNREAHLLPCDIASDESRVRILVIQTNEELAIAREAHALLATPSTGERS